MTQLGYTQDELTGMDGYWTAKEIGQQPDCWADAQKRLVADAAAIGHFLDPLLARPELRIILTGAGTSAFVGASIAPALSQLLERQVEAIATTDLVSAPKLYFRKSVPTLLVSFARSGNSPESVATVDLAERLIDECYELVLTCNSDGELLRRCRGRATACAVVLPEETNDRGFAMTSSFSTMVLCALSIFSGIDRFTPRVARISTCVRKLLERNSEIKSIADCQYDNVTFLGSNSFKGLAQEASLKLLELTDGRVHTNYDSPLGIRHGPKAGLNGESLVVIFMSNDEYTRKYDQDILDEFIAERQVKRIVALRARTGNTDTKPESFAIDGVADLPDPELLFPYIVFAQIFAFHQAVRAGCRPDNPNATGTVNRVVQGVTIHACDS